MLLHRHLCLLCLPLFCNSIAFSEQLSLGKILNLGRVKIATKSERELEDAPSSVTVITRSDIKKSMCRDLLDVMQLIPGFTISKDQGWDLGLAARGLFAYEGRALFMLNGMQLNGLYFGTYNLGNEIPVHTIERIEVIRGPGSVIYGGSAELAVINIITDTDDTPEGTTVFARYGQLTKDYGHRDFAVQTHRLAAESKDVSYHLLGFAGEAVTSNQSYGYFGKIPERKAGLENQRMRDHYSAIGRIFNEQSNFKFFLNRYTMEYVNESFSSANGYLETPSQYDQMEVNAAIEHTFQLNPDISLKPSYDYQLSNEWKYPNTSNREITRQKLGLTALYSKDSWEILTGVESFVDQAKVKRDSNDPLRDNIGFYKNRDDTTLRDKIDVTNQAAFAGITYFWKDGSAIFGLRHDANEIYGGAQSPRIGVTQRFGDLGTKILYSQAFRAPVTGHNTYYKYGIDPQKPWREDVLPEHLKILEFELSTQLAQEWSLTANLFQQTLAKLIEFYYNSEVNDTDQDGEPDGDLYAKNGGKLGTRGMELELKWQKGSFQSSVHMSKNQLIDDSALTYLARHREGHMGIPDFKSFANLSYQYDKHVSLHTNAFYMSKIASMSQKFCDSPTDKVCTRDLSPQTLLDIGLRYEEQEHLSLGLAIHDIFDKGLQVATAYVDSTSDDFRWKGREIALDSSYRF